MAKSPPNLRSANLNLAPILRALLREASVTRAGAALGLSPSATSGALAELRMLLDDPLLIRVGRAMRLTPRAEALIGKAEVACRALEDLLLDVTFDPHTAERTFVVSAPDYVSFLLARALMETLDKAAPGISVRFVDVTGDLEQHLTLGGIDLSMVAVNFMAWTGVSATAPSHDWLVGLVDRNHPLAAIAVPREDDLARYPQISWSPGPGLSARAAADGVTRDRPPRATARILTQSFTSIPPLVLDSDFVATVPRTLALRMATLLPLAAIELPHPRISIDTAVIWSTVRDADPAHRWFRELAAEALQAAHAPPAPAN